jgi:nucleotide-binding universal stress UspA family protein
MRELSHIICPIDFTEFSTRAYRFARSVAWHYGAKLSVQHVVEPWRYPSADFSVSPELFDQFYDTLREKSEERLQQLVDTCPHDEVQTECVVQVGMASDCILDFARCQEADLIVMGTHGRRGFDRLMLGSVTERVIRKASCPVLTVNEPSQGFISSEKQPGPIHLGRILFCSDFSENSRRALDHATSLAAEYNSELTLLHVLEDSPDEANIQPAIAAAMQQLDKLIPPEAHNAGKVNARPAVRIGRAYQQIIQLAVEAQTDLVIMTVSGSGALDLAVFGSTTHRVIQFGPCPVLVVHA